MSEDVCTDGRFEMIDRVKKVLIDSTNIETSKEDMAAIDSILFRFWQMGWLKVIDERLPGADKRRYCIDFVRPTCPLRENGTLNVRHCRVVGEDTAMTVLTELLGCKCKIVDMYIGNVIDGKLDDWKLDVHMNIVGPDDWFTEEWLKLIIADESSLNDDKRIKISNNPNPQVWIELHIKDNESSDYFDVENILDFDISADGEPFIAYQADKQSSVVDYFIQESCDEIQELYDEACKKKLLLKDNSVVLTNIQFRKLIDAAGVLTKEN